MGVIVDVYGREILDSRGNPTLYSVDYLRSDLFHFTIMRIRP